MKITEIRTIRLDAFPQLLYVEVGTDEGLVGLGETFFGAEAVEAYIHTSAAPLLLGHDPLRIELHATTLRPYVGYSSSGAEVRGNSALDVALWDLLGQTAGLPLYQLLGGSSRDRIRIYNTCAGTEYTRHSSKVSTRNWGLDARDTAYDDLNGFLHRADELAEQLLAEGITAMKIWPLDPYAEASGGQYISSADLERGLEPFRRIRDAVGSRMEIMVELHGLWNLPMAEKIAAALEPFEPFWFEDPLLPGNVATLGRFARSTVVPVATNETMVGRAAYRDLLESGAAGIVIVDVVWSGGISEARKIAAMVEAYQLPVSFHDCTGPVALAASTHLAMHLPNVFIQETVRAYYRTWYQDLVTGLPPISGGFISASDRPGLGVALQPDVIDRPGTRVRTSAPP